MDQDLAQYQWIWAAAGTETAVLRVARGYCVCYPTPSWPDSLHVLLQAAAASQLEPRLQFEAGSGA